MVNLYTIEFEALCPLNKAAFQWMFQPLPILSEAAFLFYGMRFMYEKIKLCST